MKITTINPRKKKTASRRRKAATKKPAKRPAKGRKKAPTKRKTAMPKRRTKKRTAARRRRTANPSPRRRPNRRRGRRRVTRAANTIGGMVSSSISTFAPRFAGKLAVIFVAKMWPTDASLFDKTPIGSASGGHSWSLGRYVLGVGTAYFGGKLVNGFMDGKAFTEGAMEFLLTKLIWTEFISRSKIADKYIGADGDVMVDGSGQMWLDQGGRQVAMQDTLVSSSPLDGALVSSSPLDGGMLSANAPADQIKHGTWSDSGHVDNYAAAYSG